MAKIMLRSTRRPSRPVSRNAGLSAHGTIEAKPLIQGGGLALFLWHYELAPGAEIRFDRPDHSHLLYVWKGDVAVGNEPAGFDDAVIIERHGEVVVKATGPAKLLHFYSPVPSPKDAHSRGQVHVRRKKALDRHVHPQTS